MPRRKWIFDEDLSQVLWRQLLRGPRPPSVQWPHSRRNVSAVDHEVPAAKKGKGKGSGPTKGVGQGSHQQGPRHIAAGQSSSVAVPKQRVPLSPDQVVEAARSRVAKLKQVLATLGEEDDMCLLSRKHFRRQSTKHENNLCASASGRQKVLSNGNKSESNRPRKQQRERERV